jgi:hypothetical protein
VAKYIKKYRICMNRLNTNPKPIFNKINVPMKDNFLNITFIIYNL